MKRQIKKAVFPVAGLGTRFLPATKASPKEMLPIVDKPLIQYGVEEAIAAGIDTIVFVLGRTKNAIADHFDKAYELEIELASRGKTELLNIVRDIIPSNINCVYVRQSEALGLGHAILCARCVIGEEPFGVILADDLIKGDRGNSVLNQMICYYDKYQCSILGVEQVPMEETSKYGIIHPLPFANRIYNIDKIIEKPKPSEALSNLAVVGRYILTPRIFDLLTTISSSNKSNHEIQLTDGIAALLYEEQVLAYEFYGRRHDCGNKLGYLIATVEYGVEHQELGEQFRSYLHKFINKFNLKN